MLRLQGIVNITKYPQLSSSQIVVVATLEPHSASWFEGPRWGEEGGEIMEERTCELIQHDKLGDVGMDPGLDDDEDDALAVDR